MDRGHIGKQFYCREWAFEKLKACLDKRSNSATCGTLIMADSGCGKTAFCSELVSPTRGSSLQVTLRKKLLGYHFCSVTLHDSLSAMNFLRSLSRQLVEHEVIGEHYRHSLAKSSSSNRLINDPDEYMKQNIISPLNSLTFPPDGVLYLLVDGLDECIEDHAASDFQGAQHHTIPHLLSKYHQHFPQWLALVCTCSTKSKRVSRLFTGFRKLSLDDITKSRVIQDIQQYILHRLDSDHSLKKHLNKEMAEILDKLHVKCNGCILYIELILDLVAHHSVSLWQVDSIPGTLGGLYLWMCQQLFADVTHYLSLVRPMFNVLLASRHPLTSTQIYNCVTTCYPHVKFEELTQCLQSIANILVSIYEDGRVVFFHSSFRLWLLDVKFSSRVYLCDPREGHEMLALYYTVRGPTLTSGEVREFAHHIQRCNLQGPTYSSLINTDRSPDENTILTIHEQAVWMLLSEVHLLPAPSEQNSEREMAVADKLEGSSLLSSSYVSDDEEEGSKPDVSHTVNQVDASCSLKTDITISVGSENVSDGICETDDPLSVNRTQQEAYLDISHHVLSNSQQNFAGGSQNAVDICEQVPANSSHNVTVDSKQAPVDLACSIELPHDPVSAAGSDAPLEELDCLDEELVDSDHLDVEDNTRDVVDHAPLTQAAEPMTLTEAIKLNNIEWLEAQYADGLNFNLPTREGFMPIVLASSECQLEVIEMLVLIGEAEVDMPDSSGRTALIEASSRGCNSIVEFLLNNNCDLNKADIDGVTALHAASQAGHVETVESLLNSGASPHVKDTDGSTPLTAVCSCVGDELTNHVQVAKLLLQTGCDVNEVNNSLQTALHKASSAGNLELCQLLLASPNISVDPVDDIQCTPLLHAVSQGHVKVVNLLIASGADIHHLDQDGRSSLGLACLAGDEEIVKCFLEKGLDELHRDNYGVDCLHFAAEKGHSNVAVLLLEYGADINTQDDLGRTSLFLSAQEGHLECLNVLLSADAEVDLPAHNGKTPLRVCCTCGHLSCAESLISHGADVEFRDLEGRSIVYMLSLENRAECITLLADSGADLNSADEEGRTALHVACWQGHLEVVASLLDSGADPNSEDNEGRTALQSAAWQGHSDVVQLLCERGANVNHMCGQGATPLCIAAQEGYLDVVSVLCQLGADPNHADRYGRTAFKIAMKTHNVQMLRLIENILRKYKPTTHGSFEGSRMSSSDQPEQTFYENVSTNKSNQSAASSSELVAPYAVVSLPRDKGVEESPLLIHKKPQVPLTHTPTRRALNFSKSSQEIQTVNANEPVPEAKTPEQDLSVQYFSESQRRRSVEFRQLQSQARSQQMQSIAKVSKFQQLSRHNSDLQRSAAEHKQQSVANKSPHSAAKTVKRYFGESDESSSGSCNTPASTISSTGKDNSQSSGGGKSDTNSSLNPFTQQLVRLGRSSKPQGSNVESILSGEVGYMANPRVTKALHQANLVLGGHATPQHEQVLVTRSKTSSSQPSNVSKRSFRQPTKQVRESKENKMAAIQNTARVPAYKVQYAAVEASPTVEPTQSVLASGYFLSGDELRGRETVSSVKSRQAKIVSSKDVCGSGDTVSIASSHDQPHVAHGSPQVAHSSPQTASRHSPPPALPPRKGRPTQPPLHASTNSSKPTIVGVVRPRAHPPHPVYRQERACLPPNLHKGGQKETSL